MRRFIYLAFCVAVLACALPSHAQQLDCIYTYPASPAYTLSNAGLQFCVSPTGTLTNLQFNPYNPLLVIDTGPSGKSEGNDGYGLCNETPPIAYWDYENDIQYTASWDAPVVLSKTVKSVKIARSTLDGTWTLTQTFTADTLTPAVKLVMALKNNTKASRVAYLVRAVRMLALNASSTGGMAFGWFYTNPEVTGDGLLMENYGVPKFGYMNSFVWLAGPPNPCDFAAGAYNGIASNAVEESLGIVYAGPVAAHQTKNATIIYRGMR